MRVVLAVGCAVLLIAAGFAMQGTHQPSGHIGYLGTSLAGVEGSGPTRGVLGTGDTTGVQGQGGATGVFGNGSSRGVLASGPIGVSGLSTSNDGFAVFGSSATGIKSIGVAGTTSGTIVDAFGRGVYGEAPNGGYGVYGFAPITGWAGYFSGDLNVTGRLYKSSGAFRIDHPLDPANKYLSHSFVESPDMMNIYSGNVTLDPRGEAIIELPAWFEALNGDFRYQLTCIGENAPVFIADEIAENKFRIAGGYAEMKVSWQVTGSRRDPYAVAYPIEIETLKPPHERGRYLHPDVYRQPEAMGLNFDRQRAIQNRASAAIRQRQ